MEEKKVLLHIDNLHVKFRVRGRVLTAIRGISLDIYENESIAIVGESGSGKSVFTKTFAGMLDSNGYVSEGKLIFNDEELADTVVKLNDNARKRIAKTKAYLDEHSKYEFGAKTYQKMLALESEKRQKSSLSDEERAKLDKEIKEVQTQRIELFNKKQTFDPSKEKDKIRQATADIKALDVKIKELEKAKQDYPISEESLMELDKLDSYLIEHFRLTFGNRILRQMKDFVPCYVACGGTEINGIDFMFAKKILRKFESLGLGFIRDEIDGLIDYLDHVFGEENFRVSKTYLARLKKMSGA